MTLQTTRPRPLTTRQRAVIGLVATGASNKDIARRLGITEQGVKAHVSRLLERHGATNRVELVHLTRAWQDTEGDTVPRARRAGQVELDDAERELSPRAYPEVIDRITRLARALQELDVALDLTSELRADPGTGPLTDVVRRRVTAAKALADELVEAFGARADAL